jgi:hypothetical protein
MPTYRFVLSAFGDEIADDLATQLDLLVAQDIHHLELRGAWGRNVLALDAGARLAPRTRLCRVGHRQPHRQVVAARAARL